MQMLPGKIVNYICIVQLITWECYKIVKVPDKVYTRADTTRYWLKASQN